MLQANGYIMLIDLSFAGETDGKTPLTDLCGEFQYLSPEQAPWRRTLICCRLLGAWGPHLRDDHRADSMGDGIGCA